MPFAFARRRGRDRATLLLYLRIARRVGLLILLGLVLNAAAAWPDVSPLRFPGVLQRIAISYLIASIIVLHVDAAGWTIAVAALLIGHWILLTWIPFGGYPAGTLTPDHNLAGYVDGWAFGRHALTIPIDPEGLLGTAPAAATVLIGALAGRTIRPTGDHGAPLRTVFFAGAALLAAGLVWSRVWLVSKPLWTGSFVLIATGLALIAFGATHFAVDVRGARRWARPFLWLGVNPVAVYFASEIAGHALDHAWLHRGAAWTTPKAELFWGMLEPALNFRFARAVSLACAAAFAAVWIAVAGLLYQRDIRIHV